MISTSDALIAVADSILEKINQFGPVEITKKGRKYKFVNNTFQRIQKEDKHLIINPDELGKQMATVLSYSILNNISSDIMTDRRDLCLMIVGMARELERNGWYEEENSSVINYKALKFVYVPENALKAIDFAAKVTPKHLEMGYYILYCAKLNFFHTDHHIGTRLEGRLLRSSVEKYFGEDALELPDVLTALKSFVHWGNIKGILYKLDIPGMNLDDDLKERFSSFHDAPQELKDYVYARPPSGTSKYFLVRKALNSIIDSSYAKLIPYPTDTEMPDPELIYQLCHEIQQNPIKYHLRANVKLLASSPVVLSDLSQQYDKVIKGILKIVGLIVSTVQSTDFEFLVQNSKIPKETDLMLDSLKSYYTNLVELHDKITDYEEKCWNTDDILCRLKQDNTVSIYDRVSNLRDRYPEDPRTEI